MMMINDDGDHDGSWVSSSSWGIPNSWLVENGKSQENPMNIWMIGRYPHFRLNLETSISLQISPLCRDEAGYMFLQKLEPTVRRREPQAGKVKRSCRTSSLSVGETWGNWIIFFLGIQDLLHSHVYLLLFFFGRFSFECAHFCRSYQQLRGFCCWQDM